MRRDGPIIVAMVTTLFPGGGIGAIYGTLSMAMGLGAAIGSWTSGLLYTYTGGYIASFILAITAAASGMATFWIVRALREERVVAASS